MAEYLLVIDMQSDDVATGKAYDSEALTAAVNDKIASYSRDHVIYIVNRFFWELTRKPKNFAIGLSLVSDKVFEKRQASCFTNQNLTRFLEESGAESLEFIGVDGNGCFNASAASHKGYQVSVDLSCLGVINKEKFQKTLQQWQIAGIVTKGELP